MIQLPSWNSVIIANRRMVLSIFHGAHHGVSAMERRPRSIVFWPGMTNDIHAVCDSCVHCNRNAPSHAATPRISSNPPATPFEKIFADYFDYGARHFLVIGGSVLRLGRCVWHAILNECRWGSCISWPPTGILCHVWGT